MYLGKYLFSFLLLKFTRQWWLTHSIKTFEINILCNILYT